MNKDFNILTPHKTKEYSKGRKNESKLANSLMSTTETLNSSIEKTNKITISLTKESMFKQNLFKDT